MTCSEAKGSRELKEQFYQPEGRDDSRGDDKDSKTHNTRLKRAGGELLPQMLAVGQSVRSHGLQGNL